ncbi:serine acetyltransferase [bacterium]|nr:serine acetyltransferase [bacterium]
MKQSLEDIAKALVEGHPSQDIPDHLGHPRIPSTQNLSQLLSLYETLLFPDLLGKPDLPSKDFSRWTERTVVQFQDILAREGARTLRFLGEEDSEERSRDCAQRVTSCLPDLKSAMAKDALAGLKGDPAARSVEEIILCYPGFKAVMVHRLAHLLWQERLPLLPRILSELAHAKTGCDIHPGATIGTSFFIDHATGVVIGETAVIGDRVRIYQGVTLGGRSYEKDAEGALLRAGKRHPTVEDDCVIYANATILGGNTVLGSKSVVGGNVFLTHSVPAGSIVSSQKTHLTR